MSWSRPTRRGLLGLAALSPLAACGFAPIYAEGGAAAGLDGAVGIGALSGGDPAFLFALRDRLETRLGPAAAPRYLLDVAIEIVSIDRAITSDNTATRFTLDGRARFNVAAGGDTPLLSDQVRATTAYSAIASPFATRSAEEDARRRLAHALADQIVIRLGATARDWTG